MHRCIQFRHLPSLFSNFLETSVNILRHHRSTGIKKGKKKLVTLEGKTPLR